MIRRLLLVSVLILGTGSLSARQRGLGNLPDLVGPLKATPGCLGVETAQTSSGKLVIFAWFTDRAALLRWYSSDLHQQLMTLGPSTGRPPLSGIAEGVGPILAIASLTPSATPGNSSMPFTQMAIELYQPLPGGAFVNGRFAPSGVNVPDMVGLTAGGPK
jgi:quinol monooxygenase YgiN